MPTIPRYLPGLGLGAASGGHFHCAITSKRGTIKINVRALKINSPLPPIAHHLVKNYIYIFKRRESYIDLTCYVSHYVNTYHCHSSHATMSRRSDKKLGCCMSWPRVAGTFSLSSSKNRNLSDSGLWGGAELVQACACATLCGNALCTNGNNYCQCRANLVAQSTICFLKYHSAILFQISPDHSKCFV